MSVASYGKGKKSITHSNATLQRSIKPTINYSETLNVKNSNTIQILSAPVTHNSHSEGIIVYVEHTIRSTMKQ